MEVILAEHSGFCFGVNKAVKLVYDLVDSDEKIYTYGPIIHNEEVVSDLSSKGVSVINSEDELNNLKEGTVVIRAHGIPKSTYDILEKNGLKYVDGTCPFVKRIHNIVKEHSENGEDIIVVGDPKHPEIIGIVGWTLNGATVINSVEEAQNYEGPKDRTICIVAQTTFKIARFQELVEIIRNKGYNVNVVDTICNATKERQESAGSLAQEVDAMIVIGGRNSSNTQKLYDICREHCEHTYFVQSVSDLDLDLPQTALKVGITAGASTPNNIIEEVQNYVRINF